MNARDVMTSAVISATGDTPVRDIAQLLLQNHISAIPILDKSGAPIGMVSEGDLIGRDETQRDARREWWLALLAEGESLSPDFLSGLRHPERIASDIMSTAGHHRRRGHRYRRDRAFACCTSDQARARGAKWASGRNRQPRESAAHACKRRTLITMLSLTRELWRALSGTCWRRSSGVSNVRTMRPNPMPRR